MRKGDNGADVLELQKLLVARSYYVSTDGWFGQVTENAVRKFQQGRGLLADGIAGPKTLAVLRGGQPDPRHLTQDNIEQAATVLDVAPAAILAVNEVESLGNGFLADGRPVILYERHVMYERIKDAGRDADALAAKYPEIVNPKRGGYRGGAMEWFRLGLAADTLDRDIAHESASWGKFQIMGYHWQVCGYASVASFVEAMCQNEAWHLKAFVDFVEADAALHKALKARKWAEFAKAYNGPAYKENCYDARLAAAYARHAAALAADDREAA